MPTQSVKIVLCHDIFDYLMTTVNVMLELTGNLPTESCGNKLTCPKKSLEVSIKNISQAWFTIHDLWSHIPGAEQLHSSWPMVPYLLVIGTWLVVTKCKQGQPFTGLVEVGSSCATLFLQFEYFGRFHRLISRQK